MIRRRRSTVLLALGLATVAAIGSAAAGSTAGSGSPAVALSGAQLSRSSCPASGGVKVAEAAAPNTAVKVFGHGWGHGMGMSQYGAQGAARLGCGYRTILGTYYAGSSVVTRVQTASVLLKLASSAQRSTMNADTGSVTWTSGSRTAVQPKGSTWTVTRSTVSGIGGLALVDARGKQQLFTANAGVLSAGHPYSVATLHPSGTAGSQLRTHYGTARFVGSRSGIAVTQVIGSGTAGTAVQKYLRGLGEVPVSWPLEALKAQVVAARTYLSSKYDAKANVYALSTTTADQVYRGYDQEQKDAALGGAWRKAVEATNGQVIVDSAGRVIEAMYSSSTGGYTENRQYVYGHYGISYLKAVDDSRWDNASDNIYRSWSKGLSRADLAKRFGFDSVSSWTVAQRGSSARLNGVRITGIRAGKTVTVSFTGTGARAKLGVRSPGFTFGSNFTAPPAS